MEPTTKASTSPDWSAINRDILCPLCDYNLKMLTEPRCPECGHRFEWADVLAEDRDLRGLFEHTRRPSIREAARTWLASLLSWRFWQRLKTSHPVRRGRLILFLILMVCAQGIGAVASATRGVWLVYRDALTQHTTNSAWFKRNVDLRHEQLPPETRQQFPTTQSYSDSLFPPPTFAGAAIAQFSGAPPAFFQTYFYAPRPSAVALLQTSLALLAWPVLTMMLFAVFRVSLRRAGISWPHLFRVVVYCYGVVIVAPILWWCSEKFLVNQPRLIGYGWDSILRLDQPTAWVLLILLGWLAIRLAIAMHRYLRIPRGVIMALLSQIIVMLIALQFLILITPPR